MNLNNCKSVILMIAVTALFLQTGCASTGYLASACPEPESQSPDYVIGAGDQLQIFVWRNPELSVSVPVRPDGEISVPLVEDMTAVGKTPFCSFTRSAAMRTRQGISARKTGARDGGIRWLVPARHSTPTGTS